MFEFYKISDNYRKYNDISGVKLQTENILSFNAERYMDFSVWHPTIGQGVDPALNYWKLPAKLIPPRPLFQPSVFLNNPFNYGTVFEQGFWTQTGKDYWDANVRKTSFLSMIQFIDSFSNAACPPDSPGCVGYTYGSSQDTTTRSVIDLGSYP
jgi:hypothetical protein